MAEMSMVEKVARAMEEASLGYSMSLIRLVDGVSTYSLKYSDGEYLEFSSTDEVYEHVAAKKRRTQARAAIAAMKEPNDAMQTAALTKIGYEVDWVGGLMGSAYSAGVLVLADAYRASIDAALSEEVER